MLEVQNLDVSIARTPVLRQAGLSVARGSLAGLIGRNGAGKTTLLRSIMGLAAVEGGAIRLDGRDLTRAPAHLRANLGVGYMPEDRKLVPDFTVEQNILVPVWACGKPESEARLDWIYDLMPEIARFRERKAISLSGGQQKLVALGRALAIGRSLLLLDEPFEGVAPALAQRLVEVVASLKAEGLTILLSESDHVHSASLIDALFTIERGEVRFDSLEPAA
jgi:branched-chain amino acid transport system ATP-binding protein